MTENAEVNTPNIDPDPRPAAEWVLSDISRSIDFRKEYYKYTITIATALLAFSISFPPTLTSLESAFLVKIAWLTLGMSILCGVAAHFTWAQFFISFRDFDNRGDREAGKRSRKKWTSLRRTLEIFQFLCLLIGVLGISIFASVNYQHVALHTPENNVPGKSTPLHP